MIQSVQSAQSVIKKKKMPWGKKIQITSNIDDFSLKYSGQYVPISISDKWMQVLAANLAVHFSCNYS